ncbi:MAG: NAD(P)-dependent oxidoreductase [Clostridiales bacterium]|nr:NAD(P)-dependent oxidoreductase [Clostridiales bacterium]
MKIAITGASGFIGEELIAELITSTDVEIIALTRSKHSSEASGVNSEKAENRVEWKITDYSLESLRIVLKGVDTVIHLAAVRGTTNCREDYVINEIITENILNAMVVCGVGRIVFASTISVYDDVTNMPWQENSFLEARTMYGESKIACEKLIREASDKHGFEYSIVRIAQVLGLGERRRGMMNVFLDTAASRGQIKVIGESKAKRQYIYIKDLIRVIDMLSTRNNNKWENKGSEIVNVGMSKAYSNLEIAHIVNEVYENLTPIDYDDSQVETIKSSEMDIRALVELIKYTPKDMKASIEDIKMRKH